VDVVLYFFFLLSPVGGKKKQTMNKNKRSFANTVEMKESNTIGFFSEKKPRSVIPNREKPTICDNCEKSTQKFDVTSFSCMKCNHDLLVCPDCELLVEEPLCNYCKRSNFARLDNAEECKMCKFQCWHVYWQLIGSYPPRNFCYHCACIVGPSTAFTRVPAPPPPRVHVPTKIEEKKPEETIQSNGHTPTSAAAAASVITAAAAVPITMTKAELFAKYLLMEQRMNALEKSVTGIDNTIYNDLKRIVQLETRVRHIDAQTSIDTKEATDAITELQKKVEDIVNVQNAETT